MGSESIIYHSDQLLCRLHIDGAMETTKSGPLFIFRILSGSQPSLFKLDVEVINPDTSWFWWPNHEGERGLLADVYDGIESIDGGVGGVSVVYPISASCRTVVLGDEHGGIILSAMPDEKGRVSQIIVKSKSRDRVEFHVKTGRSCWILTQYQGGPEDALEWMSRIIEKVKWPMFEAPEKTGKFLLQVGLIGPDYDCLVPADRGFMILEDIARSMLKHLGKGNWLHVFGYSHGHDILYPDFKPSEFLGGFDVLKDAVKAVHRKGQKVSFYLNLRIADESLVENDFKLQNSVFYNSLGKKVIEKAHDRTFVVMNPENRDWQDRIIKEAERLIDLGADGLELNFTGDQSLLVPLGEQWGDGIKTIIRKIQAMGVKVWYRGGTDIYPADWLEMSREESVIDSDGHIISGCVLGEFDPRLYMTLVPGRSYLVPLSRGSFPVTEGTGIIRDLENIMGGLFIYDEEYMDKIKMIMERAAQNFMNDDEETDSDTVNEINEVYP